MIRIFRVKGISAMKLLKRTGCFVQEKFGKKLSQGITW